MMQHLGENEQRKLERDRLICGAHLFSRLERSRVESRGRLQFRK
jgi:hypothetical protein